MNGKTIGAIVIMVVVVAGLFVFINARPQPAPTAASLPSQSSASGDCPQCAQLSQQIAALQRSLVSIASNQAALQSQLGELHANLDGTTRQAAASPAPQDPETVRAKTEAIRAA